jgi:hypothetical protein
MIGVISVLLLQLTVLFVVGPIANEIAVACSDGCSGRAIDSKARNRLRKDRRQGILDGCYAARFRTLAHVA